MQPEEKTEFVGRAVGFVIVAVVCHLQSIITVSVLKDLFSKHPLNTIYRKQNET